MHPTYLLLRVARHFLPDRWARLMLLRSFVLRPGLETRDPSSAIRRYVDTLHASGMPLAGRRVLILGYGGRFDVGVGILEAGASHVTLCERTVVPDDRHNRKLLPQWVAYLVDDHGRVRPRAERMALLQSDLRQVHPSTLPPFDLVLSNSVYEHLDDVAGMTGALASLTHRDGMNLHFVDLRDHFFKFPFEMLCFSERVWRGWLNPSSNLNRMRLGDYARAFGDAFQRVKIEVLERDRAGLRRAGRRIRPEFLTGNPEVDSVTQISVMAWPSAESPAIRSSVPRTPS